MFKKYFILSLTVVLLYSVAAHVSLSPVQAEEEREKVDTSSRVMQQAAERTAKKASRCEEARLKTTEQLKKFDGMKSQQDQKYIELGKKLDLLLERLANEKVAIANLEKDRASLSTMTKELSTAIGAYADSVEKAQYLAPNCDSDPTAFKKTLEDSRLLLLEVRSKVKALRSFISTTLQPDLKKVRLELTAQKRMASPKPSARASTKPSSAPSTLPISAE